MICARCDDIGWVFEDHTERPLPNGTHVHLDFGGFTGLAFGAV